MQKTNRFNLQTHEGEYETWPLKSFLLDEGELTQTKVPGYNLLLALELSDGRFLLIMDYDCPYEEQATAVLLDEDLKILGTKEFPGGRLINPDYVEIESESSLTVKTHLKKETFRLQIIQKKWFFQSPIKITGF
ncbi:MAG: hypothetical protein NXH75_11750 [Halobacteriovoraceae bacterium]|nr:hypothetical protein [Halobacteriovoraceae bacterium]